LIGKTKFTFDAKKKGRIVRYDEFWGISAKEALLQLVTPGEETLKKYPLNLEEIQS